MVRLTRPWLASLAVPLFLGAGSPSAPPTPSPPPTLTLSGPAQVAVGDEGVLSALGSPAGGRYLWAIESQAVTGGRRAAAGTPDPLAALAGGGADVLVRGLRASAAPGDVRVRVAYELDGAVAEARLSLTVVDGDLVAYRPQHGAGYGALPRTRVAEADEASALAGPGIRVNGNGDLDPAGEDDLIELEVQVQPAGAALRVVRGTSDLALWTTRDKQPGTAVPFNGNTSAPVTAGTLWVEWRGGGPGSAELALVPAAGGAPLDTLLFSTFRSIVMALGGEGQVPSNPVDPNHGTFVVGIDLYRAGYDVFLYDEDAVANDGGGAVLTEVVSGIQDRGVTDVVAFGYSHGGGSTHDLCERLELDRPAIGVFAVPFSSYVDGVENDSDTDVDQERRRPPGSGYHANHYQRGSFADFFLDGGPVPNSNPPSEGLDVETTPWGAGATHFVVDDFGQVTSFIHSNLLLRVQR